MATIKFWSEMTKATSVDGQDKVMIGKNSNGEAMYVDFQYLVNQAGAQTSDYIPIDGNTLPTLGTENKFSIVGSGTYNQSVGADVVVPENSLGIIVWDGDEWVLNRVVTIPAPVGVDTIDPEGENLPKEKAVAKYTYSKEEYVFHNFVHSFTPSELRINDVVEADPERIRDYVKIFDSSLMSIEVFNGESLKIGILQMTYNPTGNNNIRIEVFNEEGTPSGEVLFLSQPHSKNMQYYTFVPIGEGYSVKIGVQFGDLGDDKISLIHNSTPVDINNVGIKETSYTNISPSSYFVSSKDYIAHTAQSGAQEVFKALDRGVKHLSIESKEDELFKITSLSYSSSTGAALIVESCLDDDAENPNVTQDREGFSVHRVYIPSSGVNRIQSEVFSGTSKSIINIVIDSDYISVAAPNVFSKSPTLINNSDFFTWSSIGARNTEGLDEVEDVKKVIGFKNDTPIPLQSNNSNVSEFFKRLYHQIQEGVSGRVVKSISVEVSQSGTLSVLAGKNVGTEEYEERILSQTNVEVGFNTIPIHEKIHNDEMVGVLSLNDTAVVKYNNSEPNVKSGGFWRYSETATNKWLLFPVFSLGVGIEVIYSEIEDNKHSIKGRTFSILGDSISTFQGYIPQGFNTYYPREGFPDIDTYEKTWWGKLIDKEGMVLDINNSYSGSIMSSGSNSSFLNRIGDLGSSPDYIFIFGGTNDYGNSVDLGDIDFNDSYDTSTFSGAFSYIIQNTLENYPTSKLLVMIPLHRHNASETVFPNKNSAGHSIQDYQNRIKEICNIFGVPYIRTDNIVTYFNSSVYLGDGLHPNSEGMDEIYLKVKNKLLFG